MLRGFDASSVQGVLPYGQLAPDMRFVILKAQEGNGGFDPSFRRNVEDALKYGLEPFAYCFAYPLPVDGVHSGRDPREQARMFVNRVHAAHPAMIGRPLFLDLEWPAPKDWGKWKVDAKFISGWCAECAEEVEIRSEREPTLYTYWDWWQDHVAVDADVSWASLYPLWMAWYVRNWPKEGDAPKLPKAWTQWLFWQFDGNGGLRLPNGVDADFCVFNGDEAALQRLAGKGPARPVDSIVLDVKEDAVTRP